MFQKHSRTKAGEQFVQKSAKWLLQEREDKLVQEEEEEGLSQEEQERFIQDIEQRLSAYYGPALPSYPLSEAAWLSLRERLKAPTRSRRQRFQIAARRFERPRQIVPMELQQMYATLLLQVNYRRRVPDLRVQWHTRPVQPGVKTDILGRGRINLVLPRENWRVLQKAELEVLLAAGLARCSSVSRPLFLLPRACFAASLLLVLVMLPFTGVDRRAVWMLLAALACCLVSGSLLLWQLRAQAFRGDRLATQWLGREAVCLGLGLLADRSRSRHWPTLGEPSLGERIARVCGAPIASKDKRLTLVS